MQVHALDFRRQGFTCGRIAYNILVEDSCTVILKIDDEKWVCDIFVYTDVNSSLQQRQEQLHGVAVRVETNLPGT